MLLQQDSESSKTSSEEILTLSPPEYQTRHRYYDSIEKIVKHFPRDLSDCSCGFVFEDERGWAEHLTGLLFKKP